MNSDGDDMKHGDVVLFKVNDGGTLEVAGLTPPSTRAEIYDVDPRWSKSPAALADAMSDLEPLAWAVHELYTTARDDLTSRIEDAQGKARPNRERIAKHESTLAGMPDDPYDGASNWLRNLSVGAFRRDIVPAVQQWLGESPDEINESDYLPSESSAEGGALAYFRSEDPKTLDLLGVEIIEGEHPGSTYCAAELRKPIAEANSAARRAGIPVRFVSKEAAVTSPKTHVNITPEKSIVVTEFIGQPFYRVFSHPSTAPADNWRIQRSGVMGRPDDAPTTQAVLGACEALGIKVKDYWMGSPANLTSYHLEAKFLDGGLEAATVNGFCQRGSWVLGSKAVLLIALKLGLTVTPAWRRKQGLEGVTLADLVAEMVTIESTKG